MDDVLLNKIAIIENCLRRLHEEYDGHEGELEGNFTKQDSIILNLQKACEAAIDLGARIIRLKKLGLPQASREVFALLESAKVIQGQQEKMLAKVNEIFQKLSELKHEGDLLSAEYGNMFNLLVESFTFFPILPKNLGRFLKRMPKTL